MDKTRKLSAVLSDDELFKQKALEYFTAADQNESGTLSDEEVLELCRRISERGHFKMPSADKIKELLGKCDRACDGAIQSEEFEQFFRVVVGSALKMRLQEDVAQEAALLASVTETLLSADEPPLPASFLDSALSSRAAFEASLRLPPAERTSLERAARQQAVVDQYVVPVAPAEVPPPRSSVCNLAGLRCVIS